MEENKIYNCNCIDFMKTLKNNSIPLILTDIPYEEVSRDMHGICNMNLQLGAADKSTFTLDEFLPEVWRITQSIGIIFCGREQFSKIYSYFTSDSLKNKCTVRPIVWEKTNPVPANGQYVYLSGVEFAVWFKKKGTKGFKAHCKNTVFRYPIPSGKFKIHQTQKHKELFKELILDNSSEGDIVYDPCGGSFVTAWAAIETNRKFLINELDKDIYNKGLKFIEKEYNYGAI